MRRAAGRPELPEMQAALSGANLSGRGRSRGHSPIPVRPVANIEIARLHTSHRAGGVARPWRLGGSHRDQPDRHARRCRRMHVLLVRGICRVTARVPQVR